MNGLEIKYLFIIAILLSLSFPPFPLGFLAPVGIAIFLYFIHQKSCKDSFRLGYLLGLFWGAMSLFWISASSLAGAILVIVLNSFHYALVAGLFSWIEKKSEKLAVIVFPFIWIGFEYLHLFSDIRFNWLNLAHSQTYYLYFIQIVEWTGYHFISFTVILLATSIFLVFQKRSKSRYVILLISLLLVILMNLYGYLRIRQLDQKEYNLIKSGLVQPNVDPHEKWDSQFQEQAFDMLMNSSMELADHKIDLLVWPETATPFYLRTRLQALTRISHLLDSSRIHLLTGAPDYQFNMSQNRNIAYNAAFFFRPDKIKIDSYHKIALVPGSETMPFKSYLPFLSHIDIWSSDFYPGTTFNVFQWNIAKRVGSYHNESYRVRQNLAIDSVRVNISAVICYESVFPNLVRGFVQNGANLLTIITNDGWFGLTSGPYQHAQYAVYRAIEHRISIIRCANTGISGFIDPVGRYLDKASLNTQKNLVALIPLREDETLFTRSGDYFGLICLVITVIFIFYVSFLWRRFRP
jgi:apolipoprotein N-acyltransferase